MDNVAQLVIWEGEAILFALFAVLVIHLLTGQINTRGLLMKKEGDRSFSPARVQLLLATLAAASQYLGLVLKDRSHLPDVPQNWLLLYGGSHALYLGRRLYLTQTDKQK